MPTQEDSGKNTAKNNVCQTFFSRLAEEWPGVFWHEETRSFLVVYVDDFKLAAKHGEHDALWAAIRGVIDGDPETLDGRCLGCSHERFATTAQQVHTILDNHPVYHPRQKQRGASAQTQKEGEENTHDGSYKLYDPNRKIRKSIFTNRKIGKIAYFLRFCGKDAPCQKNPDC